MVFDWNSNVIALLVIGSILWLGLLFTRTRRLKRVC